MADADSQHPSKPQTPLPPISDPPIPLNINNPRKHYYYTRFMYKAALVTVFLILLPLFPSIAPEFINQTLHARSWELLQLILVGIAVSYGLFSKKNDEAAEKPDHHTHKPADALSYVSKLLQVPSTVVFDDDDDESEHESQTIIEENNKVSQTLNSQQYYRRQPVVVVAAPQQSPVIGKKGNIVNNACEFTQKPLLLPVRSLKQPSKGDSGGEEVEDVPPSVLRSPVPWRSRSLRVETIDESTKVPDADDVAARENRYISSTPPAPPPLPPRKPVLSRSKSTFTSNAAVSPEKKKALRRSVTKVEKVMMESSSDDDDEDSEEGDYSEGKKQVADDDNNNNNNSVDDDDVGPDVDKKADEFIAKFREQIRLQRIESIRRTTAQRRAGKASRSN